MAARPEPRPAVGVEGPGRQRRRTGRRRDTDLHPGEDRPASVDREKTGAGKLFSVFGEPDIDVRVDGDQVTVEVVGVDVYDPTAGIVRGSKPIRSRCG